MLYYKQAKKTKRKKKFGKHIPLIQSLRNRIFFFFFIGIPYIFSTGFWYICMIFLFHCYYDFVQHVVKLISIL